MGSTPLVPLVLLTQRPDRFCRGLMEGRVGVFCDGIAQGWLVPGTAALFLRGPQDRDNQWLSSRALLFVRYLSVAFSLLPLYGIYLYGGVPLRADAHRHV